VTVSRRRAEPDVGVRNLAATQDRARSYRLQGLWTADTLSSRVQRHAEERGDAIAVIDDGGARRHTYAELGRHSSLVADMLLALGVEPGDVVSVQLPNAYETVVVAVAVQSVGGVVNPLLPNYRSRELAHVVATAHPRVLFTPAIYRGWDYREMVHEVQRLTGVAVAHVVVDQDSDDGDVALREVLDRSDGTEQLRPGLSPASAVSELIFTSGTEATPKAIMHTEETTNFAARTLFQDLEFTETPIVWMPSPVGHSTGFNCGLRPALYHGVTLVLQDRWQPATAIDLLQSNGCNYTLAATTFLQDLVEECERTDTRLPQMTHFGCGGAPVPADLVARADQLGLGVLRLYGSTEVLCATWNRPDSPFDKRATTDGFPLSHCEIELRAGDDRRVELPGKGEIYVRGPNTSIGFLDDEVRSKATYLPDGWVRSGDLAQIDADGYMTVVGRKKEIIIRGGVNIAPREIEDMLVAFPEVERAAVVGIPDARLGERSCACVILRPGSELAFDTMTARLRNSGLATYKLPEQIRILDDFPLTASGKVQKHEILREMLSRDQSDDHEWTSR
jgi:acyl-CoA synthetase (AMP-forming)/AMP-acid ligase II